MAELKKKRSGCLTALLVVAGIGVVTIVALVVAGYFIVKSERGQEFFDAIESAEKSSQAPGTDAMRDIGCKEPSVMTVGGLMSMTNGLIGGFIDDAQDDFDKALKDVSAGLADVIVVMCVREPSGSEVPECSALASAYAEAVADGPERVIVMAGNSDEDSQCDGYYDRDGKRLGGVGKNLVFVPES